MPHTSEPTRATHLLTTLTVCTTALSLAACSGTRSTSADKRHSSPHRHHAHDQHQAPAGDVGPRHFDYRVGDVELTMLNDGITIMGDTFPFLGANAGRSAVQDAAETRVPTPPGVAFNVSGLLIRHGGRTVLIDAGYGPFAQNRLSGHLPAALAEAGVDPAEVDVVLISHNHIDHTGGLLLEDQKTPRFPNADVLMTQQEIDFWTGNPDLSRLQIPDDFKQFLISSGSTVLNALGDRVRAIRDGEEVAPGIVAVELPGHTPGHVGFRIELSGADGGGPSEAFYMGDLVHFQPLQLCHPTWFDGADSNPEQGVQTRLATLASLVEPETLVIGPHLPFPAMGRVAALQPEQAGADDGNVVYEWLPLIWADTPPRTPSK